MNSKAFITGSDKGLGRALTQRFLQADWRVFAGRYDLGRGVEDDAARGSAMLTEVPLDVTDLGSVREAARIVSSFSDSIDVLVNNAAVLSPLDGVLEEADLGEVMRTLDVNACGPLRVVQQFLPLLQEGRVKLIVNISSEAGSIQDCERTIWFGYCMSKAALNMQSRLLSNYLIPRGFSVLAVHPGGMQTDMLPNCTRSPEEAAESIYALVENRDLTSGELFVQFDGTALRF